MLTKTALRNRILLIIGVLIVANWLFSRLYFRLDFTADKRYTLSNATRNILSGLEEPITVTGYFSDNLPPAVNKARTDFEEMLVEYANASGGNLVFDFVNPSETPEKEKEVQQAGIQPVGIQVRERNEAKQQRAYLGAKLQYKDKTEIIPVIQPGQSVEYDLSSLIKKMAAGSKPKIGLVQGHGEATLQAIPQAAQELTVLYDVVPATLSDSALVSKYQTLAIIAPRDSFAPGDFAALDKFLASGKGILVALNQAETALPQSPMVQPNATGLSAWLTQKGVTVGNNMVVDKQFGSMNLMVPQQFGSFGTVMAMQQVRLPYIPLVKKFAEHPITNGIEGVSFPFVSSLAAATGGTGQFTPLAFSSAKSGIVELPTQLENEVNEGLYITSGLALAGVVEGNLSGNTPARMVVFGDADFCLNSDGTNPQAQPQEIDPNNVILFVNALDWLTDNSGLAELRTKGITGNPITAEGLTDAKKDFIRWINFLLPLGLVIGYGFYRSLRRNRQKTKWATERYT